MIAFGPVPSRRLGRSLGINNIPPKICTYSCVYCQLGRTTRRSAHAGSDNVRGTFYDPDEIFQEVRVKVEKAHAVGEAIDYLTFVPDGEPTLDANLGREIELLSPLAKIAVICNASLIGREDVRCDLMGADWVSLKVDAVDETAWRQIDRPRRSSDLSAILDGLLKFSRAYEGKLVTETMLVRGVNDGERVIQDTAEFIARMRPAVSYLSIPIRPPAEDWVHPPDEETLNRAFQIMNQAADPVEYLIGYEGNEFAFTGDAAQDLLSITSVHPMREDAVTQFLERAGAGWGVIDDLLLRQQLVETAYEGRRFYMRRLR